MRYWFYGFCKIVLWIFFRLGFGLEVRGQDQVPIYGAFILASNHISSLDPPLLGAACRRRLSFMARTSLFGHALLGAFLRAVHVIPLRRGEGDLGAMRAAVQRLQRGEVVAIFPEGGRQLSGVLGSAKRGVGLLAATARVPIVPAVVSGTLEALPPGAKGLRRAKIQVAFGPAIPYTRTLASPHGTLARDHHQALADAVSREWRRLAESLRS